jgi:ABC-2 type transport system permease protein
MQSNELALENPMNKQIIPGAERRLNNHTGFIQLLRDSLTMAYRGLLKIRRNPEQLVDVVFTPIVFTVLFAYLFGGAVAGGVKNYLPTIIPGLLAQAILTGSVAIGVQLREDMNKGVFDRFKSMPIARIAPLAGALLADTIRYAIVTVLTFAMGYIMGFRPGAGLGWVVLAGIFIIMFAWCISWIFAFLGVISKTATSVQGISLLVVFPLTFLSNAFVPVNTLPAPLKWFANANPVSHLITAVRQMVNQGVIGHDFWLTFIIAVGILAIFVPLTVRAYMRKA